MGNQNFVIVMVLLMIVSTTRDLVVDLATVTLAVAGVVVETLIVEEEEMITGGVILTPEIVVGVSVAEAVVVMIPEITDVGMITIVGIDMIAVGEAHHHATTTEIAAAEWVIGTIQETQDPHTIPEIAMAAVDVLAPEAVVVMIPEITGAVMIMIVGIDLVAGETHHRDTMIEVVVVGMIGGMLDQRSCALERKASQATTIGCHVTAMVIGTKATAMSRNHRKNEKCYVRWQKRNCKIT